MMKSFEIISEEKNTIPEYIKMYEISGQNTITEHSFNRYNKNKKLDSLIKEQIKNTSNINPNYNYDFTEKKITNTDEDFLIKESLTNSNQEIEKNISERIKNTAEEKVGILIEQLLKDPNVEIKKAAARNIWNASGEERFQLIKLCLENPNIEINRIGVGLILYSPKKGSLLKLCLENPNIEIQELGAKRLRISPENELNSLVELCLENPNIEIQELGVENVLNEHGSSLINKIIKKGLGKKLIETRLYKKNNIEKNTFSRQEFEKTGSETTLIGKELMNKVIIRHIKPEAFLSWQKIYENYKIWQNFGFDYVPIEPILSYELSKKNGLVDVYSGILDLNLAEWKSKTDLFTPELNNLKQKILNVLDQEKIKFGNIDHINDSNFCLRFFRNKKNEPDFERAPRLYLIDFDQATSPEFS